MNISRRRFLGMGAAASVTTLLTGPGTPKAAVHPTGRNLVIVWVNGG